MVCAALPAVSTFAFDAQSFWRESAAGVSPTAFFTSRVVSDLPALAARATLFALVFWSTAALNVTLSVTTAVFLGVAFCASGSPRAPPPHLDPGAALRRSPSRAPQAWPIACPSASPRAPR